MTPVRAPGGGLGLLGFQALHVGGVEEDAHLLIAGAVQLRRVCSRQAPGLVAAPDGCFADAQVVRSFSHSHKIGPLIHRGIIAQRNSETQCPNYLKQ
jgi:hypothetical protein